MIRVKEDWKDVTKGEGLDLKAANGGVIPFIGWAEVEFHLTSYVQTSILLKVQILVTRDELVYPIIHGYNVIEKTIRNKWQGGSKGAIFDIMNFALVDVNVKSVSALVEFVQGQMKKACVFEKWYINSLTVPAGQKVGVPCYVSCGPLERRRWQPQMKPSLFN